MWVEKLFFNFIWRHSSSSNNKNNTRFFSHLKIVRQRLVIENTSHLKLFRLENISGFEDFEKNSPSWYVENNSFEKNSFENNSFEKNTLFQFNYEHESFAWALISPSDKNSAGKQPIYDQRVCLSGFQNSPKNWIWGFHHHFELPWNLK